MFTHRDFILISGHRVQFHSRRILACLFSLLFSICLMHVTESPALSQMVQKSISIYRAPQEPGAVQWLTEGKPIERKLSGGESHSYQLNLNSGQYARVIVEQKGIDVVVNLYGPDGKLITAVDNPNGSVGAETVHITAEATGIYRLEVKALENRARAASYEAKLVEVRIANQADKQRLVARRAFDEADRLQAQNTPDSLKAAIKKYEEAFAIYKAIVDPIEQFTVLFGLHFTYRNMYEYQKALECLDQAFEIARTLGDKYRQAYSLQCKGYVYRGLLDFENTLRNLNEALQIYRAIGDKRAEATLLYDIGGNYDTLGELEKAREYFEQAVRLSQFLEDKEAEAGALEQMGYSYHLQYDRQNTLDYYSRALAIWRSLKNAEREAKNLAFISGEYARRGDRQKAVATAGEALDLIKSANLNLRTKELILVNVGWTYYKLGELEKALTFFDEPARVYEKAGNSSNRAIILKHIATVLRDLGRLDEAKVNIETCLAIMEFIRDHAGDSGLQSSFIANFFEFYEFYIDLLMRIHDAHPQDTNNLAALAFTEKVKQRSLVEILVQARVNLQKGVNVSDSPNSRYASLTAPQPLSIKEIQQQVLDDNTVLLEFELGEERSYLWTITRDGVASYQLPSKEKIDAQTRRVYELLIARQPAANLTLGQQRAREKAADLQFQTEASVLSNMLLTPVAKQLGTKRLVIVADGALQYLPFSVLPTPTMSAMEKSDLKPLILDHEIVSLPSASVLAVLRRELADRKPAPKAVAVLADPVFEMDDARVKAKLTSRTSAGVSSHAATSTLGRALRSVKGNEESIKLQRLLFSRDEAEAILSLTSNQSNLEALDFRANRKLAMSDALSQYRIVHFSTHGLLDSRHPELSGLVLSLVDEAGRPQEGFLRLQDIYTLRLSSDLVVLSACQTGLGKDVRGEGLIGMVRGFMYAGAPRVMASMWEVDDAATAELMKRFYKGVLQEKLTPAAALRAAQIEMLKKSHWQSPYYWGAFVLQGEWR